jgi:hypothetical protein
MITRPRFRLAEPHPEMAVLISSYQYGLTTPAETRQVERHLLECEPCHAFYGELQEARALIAGLPRSDPPPAQLATNFAAIWRRTIGRALRHKPAPWTKRIDK